MSYQDLHVQLDTVWYTVESRDTKYGRLTSDP
jgi:hypothetical protein